ncbi:MAG TPA: hypothetical protein VKB59_21125 [Micromonosporaceae bacterium]|nr:hypothetical protein [Micromonosporaceae bacterium]
MTDDESVRYKVGLSAQLAQRYSRDRLIGASFKQVLADDVIADGVVVNWVDGDDGTVTLVIEAREL